MKLLPVRLGIILVVCLVFLVSCSSSPSGGKWVKPDSGESEFDEDHYKCKRKAERECNSAVWPGYFVQVNCIDNLISDCLKDRGWEYKKP